MPLESGRLFDRARRVMPSGVSSPVRYYAPYPFFAKRARAGRIWDADGRRYVDLCNGYGAILLGHAHAGVASAASSQLRSGALFCAPTEAEAELAAAIASAFPSVQSVRLVNTGAEAAMAAIRLARGRTGRSKIIKFEGCYHGAYDPLLVAAGSGAAHYGVSSSLGVTRGSSRDTLVVPYNDAAALEDAVRRHAHDLAGIIIEPVAANMGLVPPAPGFLRRVRRLASGAGALLIFDEVVTGFRLAPGGAQEYYGVRPDLTTMAKALGGGLAIGALGGPRNLMGMLAPSGGVYQASTFAGNPVATAAALAFLRALRKAGRGMYRRLESRAASLASAISDAAASAGADVRVNRASSMLQAFFTDAPVTDFASSSRSDPRRFDAMFRGLLAAGVFAAPSRFETVFLSAAHTEGDMRLAEEAYAKAVAGAA